MTNVLFTSACVDSSGYAEASRNYICALNQQTDIDLSLKATSFESWQTDIGKHYKEIITPLLEKTIKPDVQIIHLTPENYRRFKIPGIKNIAYTVWETSKLPDQWVPLLNDMDEIWVPCDWNVQVFRESGVKIPVKKVPHTFNRQGFTLEEKTDMFNVDEDRFVFYSIFQWSARKNPEGLLKAYFSEFSADENVCLVLKTYVNDNSPRDKEQIKRLIQQIKQHLWIPSTPPVILIHDSLSRNEILNLHSRGDCFVLPHRAEGWGIPHFEAMALGNTCISTRYSGNLEFMNDDNSVLVNCEETPCFGMNRPTYNGKMMWAEPSVRDLMKKMRAVYEGERRVINPSGVLDTFSWESVGAQMKELL